MKRIAALLVLALSACTTSSNDAPTAPASPTNTTSAPSSAVEACIDEDAMRRLIQRIEVLMDTQNYDRVRELASLLELVALRIEVGAGIDVVERGEPFLTDVAQEFHDAGDEFRRVRQYLHPLDLVKATEAYAAGTTAASHAAKLLSRVATRQDYC